MTTFILKLGTDYNEGLASALRRRIYAFDPQILVGGVIPLEQLREDQLWAERMANSVFQVLAAIALFLTVAGIFSVLAYTVDRRMGEFGVRMALGATPRDLVQLVLDRGLKLTLLGIATGLAGALALGRFLKALLFESTANDPWVLGGVALVLVAAAALACVLPARRAARVDVSKLLRSE
jgi:putative ABC transport system permease protein